MDKKYVSLDNLSLYHNNMKNYIFKLLNEFFKNDFSLTIYPIGSIYMSINPTSPSDIFGGVWEQIKDVFLLASSDNYIAGSTGGEASHVLTIEEMPSHTHIYKRHAFSSSDSDPETGENIYGVNNKTLNAHEGTTGSTGGGQPHNNMPPYLAVYMWKRIG